MAKTNQKPYGNKNITTTKNGKVSYVMPVEEKKTNYVFVFTKWNYILLGVGVLLLALGYILLSGGGSDDPNVFNPAMFDSRRLVVAPILLMLGFIVEIVAIMINPASFCKKDQAAETEEEQENN